ncbi:MAG: nitroreductase [Tissierellia bacterium]|nr:nitroreductase [Tissierellia bacterium]
MLMNNFLRNRKSIRDFKNRDIDGMLLDEITEYCDRIGTEGYRFSLFQDGKDIFKSLEGIGGYAGVMIKSPHYVGVNIKGSKEENIIYGAYNMEYLITKLTELGIGSCWINLNDVDINLRKELLGSEEGDMDYLLAIGYPAAKNPFAAESISHRMGVEDMVYDGEMGKHIDMVQLQQRGLDDLFYYIRFAPSSYNRQPWRFVLKDDRVILLLMYSDEEELSLVDAGIIMYYFEALAKTMGIEDKWTLIDRADYEDGELSYRYIGEFKI